MHSTKNSYMNKMNGESERDCTERESVTWTLNANAVGNVKEHLNTFLSFLKYLAMDLVNKSLNWKKNLPITWVLANNSWFSFELLSIFHTFQARAQNIIAYTLYIEKSLNIKQIHACVHSSNNQPAATIRQEQI